MSTLGNIFVQSVVMEVLVPLALAAITAGGTAVSVQLARYFGEKKVKAVADLFHDVLNRSAQAFLAQAKAEGMTLDTGIDYATKRITEQFQKSNPDLYKKLGLDKNPDLFKSLAKQAVERLAASTTPQVVKDV